MMGMIPSLACEACFTNGKPKQSEHMCPISIPRPIYVQSLVIVQQIYLTPDLKGHANKWNNTKPIFFRSPFTLSTRDSTA